MYLAGRMPERTTILMTGGGLGLVEQSCAMARALQPATLILEDVDLVAEERTVQQKASVRAGCQRPPTWRARRRGGRWCPTQFATFLLT